MPPAPSPPAYLLPQWTGGQCVFLLSTQRLLSGWAGAAKKFVGSCRKKIVGSCRKKNVGSCRKKIVDGRRVEFLRSAFRSSRGQIILGPSRGRIIGGRGGDSRPHDHGGWGVIIW